MAYNESLARRVHAALEGRPGLTVRKMFGGIAYMAHGNMALGVLGNDLMVRGVINHEEQYKAHHIKPLIMQGRPARSMILVEPAGTSNDRELQAWIERGWAYALALPPK